MGGVTSSVAAKFAFFPPTLPSYTVVANESCGGALCIPEVPRRDDIDVLRLRTRKGNDVVAVHISHPKANSTLLYSHGNAADLDIDAVYKCLKEKYGVKDDQLILYGQSVGSGPTIDLAARIPDLRGVVLHSPILSGLRVLYPVKRTYWFDIYKNIDKIGGINCPILVIHGTADDVVDCSHGKRLWELCTIKYDPIWINGGGHCNLELYPKFIKHLKKFVLALGKLRQAPNVSAVASLEPENKSKSAESNTADTIKLPPDLPEISRNSLDSRLDKSRKSSVLEKSRMSTDRVDRFRRRKHLIW